MVLTGFSIMELAFFALSFVLTMFFSSVIIALTTGLIGLSLILLNQYPSPIVVGLILFSIFSLVLAIRDGQRKNWFGD